MRKRSFGQKFKQMHSGERVGKAGMALVSNKPVSRGTDFVRTSNGKKHCLEKYWTDEPITVGHGLKLVPFSSVLHSKDRPSGFDGIIWDLTRFWLIGPFDTSNNGELRSWFFEQGNMMAISRFIRTLKDEEFWLLTEQRGTSLGDVNGWKQDPGNIIAVLKSRVQALVKPMRPNYSDAFIGQRRGELRKQALKMLEQIGWPLIDQEVEAKFGESFFQGWTSIVPNIVAHYEPIRPKPDLGALKRAMKFTIEEILEYNGGHKVIPFSLQDTFDRLMTKTDMSTGSGWPFNRNTSKLSIEQWRVLLDLAEKFGSGSLSFMVPVVPGQRAQEGREDENGTYVPKNRLILAASKVVHLAAGRFIYPLQDVMSKVPCYEALLGNPALVESGSIMRAIHNAEKGWSIDFTKFDTTVRTLLTKFCAQYMHRLFDEEHREFWRHYTKQHVVSPVFTPEGMLWGAHGLMSGQIDTNCVGNLLNRVIAVYTVIRLIERRRGAKVSDEELKRVMSDDIFHRCMGDDTVFIAKTAEFSGVSLSEITAAHAELGLNSSNDPDKVHEFSSSSSLKTVSFLSRFYQVNTITDTELVSVPLVLKVLSKYWSPEKLTIYEEALRSVKLPISCDIHGDFDDQPGIIYHHGSLNESSMSMMRRMSLRELHNSEFEVAHCLVWLARLESFDTVPDPWFEQILIWFANNTPTALRPSVFSSSSDILREVIDLIGGNPKRLFGGDPSTGMTTTRVWKRLLRLEARGVLKETWTRPYGYCCTTENIGILADSRISVKQSRMTDDELLAEIAAAVERGELSPEFAQSVLNAIKI